MTASDQTLKVLYRHCGSNDASYDVMGSAQVTRWYGCSDTIGLCPDVHPSTLITLTMGNKADEIGSSNSDSTST